MRKKQLIALIIVLAAVVVALLAVLLVKKNQAAKEEEQAEEEVVYVKNFDPSEVTAFTFLSDDQLLIFDLEDGTWVYTGDTSMEMDADSIESFLTSMSNVTANSVISDAEDLSEYGVDDPSQMFAVVLEDGSSLTYCFGLENEVIGGYYVQVTDDADDTDNDKVYLVNGSVVTYTLNKTAEDFQVEEEEDEASE